MLSEKLRDVVVSDYAQSLIHFKARQLSKRPGFRPSEWEDLEQELWTALVSQAENFDPKRACFNTFAARIVGTAAGMIIRERRRRKRAEGFRAQSLDSAVDKNGEAESLAACVSETDSHRRNGTVPPDSTTEWIDADAFKQAWGALPDDMTDVLRRVMGGSKSSAARDLGISRRQIAKVLEEAKSYFERAGFGDC